jgi:peptidoglycan/xylan/chitin deacetylase (PgdA/CDA1 family)
MTSYTSGDAKWYFNPVAVTAGDTYTYSDSYESNVSTEVIAEYETASGALTYQDFGAAPASSTWTTYTQNLTVPTGITNLTIFHLIQSVGTLQTGNFSLSLTPTQSTLSVSITDPTSNATLAGTQTIDATATDTSGIKSVQFELDGSPLGTAVTTAPYQYSWNTTTATNGGHTLTAIATNVDGISTTSASVPVTVSNVVSVGTNLIANPNVATTTPGDTTTPEDWNQGNWGTNTTAFSYPTTGPTTGSRSVEVQMTSYTSGDAKWYFNPVAVTAGDTYTYSDSYESNVATDVMAAYTTASGTTNYVDLGSAPASASAWEKYSASFVVPSGTTSMTVYHLISSVGKLQTGSFSLTQNNAPSVSISAPVANATVTGTQTVSATANASAGVKSVQFELDGSPLGTAVATAPYQYSWNSATASNGAHSLSAIVTDENGVTATATAVSITVNNVVTPTNLIPNPLVETPDPNNAAAPEDWSTDNWGTNTATFTYEKTGYDSTRSLNVNITSYTSGDGKWAFNPITATADTQYKFSEYYESNVQTEVDAAFTLSDGTIDYQIIGLPGPATTWTNFTSEFAIPLGTQTFTIYHIVDSVGSLTTSDFSLTTYKPVGFSSPLLTLTFDDGYVNQYTQTMPLLKQYGYSSTQFIITDLIGNSGYLTKAEIQSLNTAGNEIASHTVTHDDLTQETTAQLQTEMSQSQATLKTITGTSPTDLAYPYGLYNSAVIAATKPYYVAARGVEDGLNSKDNFNAYDLKVQNVYNTTTTAQIADWVSQAQATDTWLILVYHSVNPNAGTSGIYNVTPTQLTAQLNAIKSSGIKVETMKQGLATVTPQL